MGQEVSEKWTLRRPFSRGRKIAAIDYNGGICDNLLVKTSVVIIAFNEEDDIGDAIRSARWADEVLVVDSDSTDRTREIAEELGARVVVQKWLGFSQQKQFGTDNAANDRIFSLDADERISAELREEILAIAENDLADGYSIPRLSFYLGRPIRHGGWYPDRQMRYFDRRKGRWSNSVIHESFKMNPDAKIGRLLGEIDHYSVKSIGHHSRMIAERYAPLGAREMFEKGRTTSPIKIAFTGIAAFIRGYFLKLGFLDGFPGFIIAWFAAYNNTLKHLLLWEMTLEARGDKNRLSGKL